MRVRGRVGGRVRGKGREGEREGKEGGRKRRSKRREEHISNAAIHMSAAPTISCMSIGGVESVSYWKSSSQHGRSSCMRVETVPSLSAPGY